MVGGAAVCGRRRRCSGCARVPHRIFLFQRKHFCLGNHRDGKSTRLHSTLFPYTTLFRSACSAVPLFAVAAGYVLVALGLLIGFFSFKENTFASAIIEIGTGQIVISSGPYALVRHPM